MKLIKTTGLLAVAFGLVALCAREAAAQAPTLTVTAIGNSVTMLWTPLPGAAGYTLAVGTAPGAANIATVNLPASITRIVVAAPTGTYYLRVRGFVGGIVGPMSNEAAVAVGATPPPPPCAPPAAPTVTTTVSGLAVTVNWSNVGAQSYRVIYGRTPGGVDLIQAVGAATASSLNVGFPGTFYVFVQAHNACGDTNSIPVAFTLGSSAPPGPGGGTRTPNPPPGQLLPAPTYGQSVVDVVSRQYAGDLANACNSRAYLFRLLNALRQRDTRWGLNWKRGHAGSLSTDVITYNPTDRPDEGESRVYLFDVVGAICEGNYPTFHDVTAVTWASRGNPICGSEWCARWTIQPYLAAGFPADERPQQ